MLGDGLGELAHEVALHVGECGTVVRVQHHGVGVGNLAGVVSNLGVDHADEPATHLDRANCRVVDAQSHVFIVRLGSVSIVAMVT